MTKKQCIAKIRGMLKKQDILKECGRLIDSGALDLSTYANDYVLPKIVLSVALENQASQWRPLHDNNREDYNNLKHF